MTDRDVIDCLHEHRHSLSRIASQVAALQSEIERRLAELDAELAELDAARQRELAEGPAVRS